ncbi:hypothetical protein H920_05174 [Fukomys damarensis]|uniref:Uncharacterized protein n=1 Tax=Fukomys damarensis TaxID=885580 RepID=A0A091DSZ6_FUKDA|nr:hypothetical protein H920_05174 [Fukomys damarensis]
MARRSISGRRDMRRTTVRVPGHVLSFIEAACSPVYPPLLLSDAPAVLDLEAEVSHRSLQLPAHELNSCSPCGTEMPPFKTTCPRWDCNRSVSTLLSNSGISATAAGNRYANEYHPRIVPFNFESISNHIRF